MQLTNDYGVTKSNGEEVIRRMLEDHNKEESMVQTFLKTGGNDAELQLIIQIIQLSEEITATNRELLEVQKKRYL